MRSFFQRYLLPGLIFQSVTIAGGYATGREIVEFFFNAGPTGGLLGILVAMVIWSITLAACFELARVTKSYDYQTYFSQTLGRGSILFEITYMLQIILVISIVGAAAGELLSENYGIKAIWGTVTMMISVAILVFFGSGLIEKFLSLWSIMLYLAYAAFVILCISVFGDKIATNFTTYSIGEGWFISGLTYSGYNLATIAAVLFCIRHIKTRKEAISAGLLAGPIAMIPAIFFFVAMIGYYPEIMEQSLPVNYLLNILDVPVFKILFEVILFGTFIETCTALIHSVNERIAVAYDDRKSHMPRYMRPVIALVILFTAIVMATNFGVVNLISSGYGTLTWIFIILIIVPLFTIGIRKIIKQK
ncbi:MAG: hypothetical protein HN583_08070 [Kordiimonadaceae bacterium]|jgi:uncharacterized membrane protein YkvI|nr:hypothetical protein [Kordiimonadaceae bacterium]MDC0081831.1 hypothetical protein [Emcibacteraceae bacterium]MBT6466341.1 hypothetical protein [Kordiimonadaceae bacterium]MBT7544935.1 hypothetical protein [Kordiimonadaceae bacterium]MBT7605626.1 hypothetical protein [Kordiimonadaceae bacterium]|tara:strand:+ start:201 stop:1283 length:1083 start_codon:yes stop_codon:yes gene_type:complete